MTRTSDPVESLWRLSDEDVAAAIHGCERELRRAHARMIEALGEGDRRGLGVSLGYGDLMGFIREELHLSAREAKARLSTVHALEPRRALAGGTLAAPLAATGRALADGVIGPEHVRVLVDVFDRCPRSVSPEACAEAERTLLELAAQATPDAVRAAGRRLIAYWQAEDKPPTDEDLVTPRREFRYRYQRTGAMVFSGRLDAETAAALEGLFGPLAKPRPAADSVDGPVRDPRTTAERQGDAFAEIIDCAARADDMTVQGGERAVLTVTLSLTELEGRVRRALVDVPGHTSVDQLRRLACEAEVVPAIFGNQGQPLYLGRSRRTATKAQRRALALRDRGCVWPGCYRPPKYCQAHHVDEWGHGGPSDIDKFALLCDRHHRTLHHTDWQIRMSPADGMPELIPPARVDPARMPLRNLAHRTTDRAIGPPGDSPERASPEGAAAA